MADLRKKPTSSTAAQSAQIFLTAGHAFARLADLTSSLHFATKEEGPMDAMTLEANRVELAQSIETFTDELDRIGDRVQQNANFRMNLKRTAAAAMPAVPMYTAGPHQSYDTLQYRPVNIPGGFAPGVSGPGTIRHARYPVYQMTQAGKVPAYAPYSRPMSAAAPPPPSYSPMPHLVPVGGFEGVPAPTSRLVIAGRGGEPVRRLRPPFVVKTKTRVNPSRPFQVPPHAQIIRSGQTTATIQSRPLPTPPPELGAPYGNPPQATYYGSTDPSSLHYTGGEAPPRLTQMAPRPSQSYVSVSSASHLPPATTSSASHLPPVINARAHAERERTERNRMAEHHGAGPASGGGMSAQGQHAEIPEEHGGLPMELLELVDFDAKDCGLPE